MRLARMPQDRPRVPLHSHSGSRLESVLEHPGREHALGPRVSLASSTCKMPKIKAKVSGNGNAALTAALLTKTRLCGFYAQGRCTRGGACTFAHGVSEITKRPDFSRTQVCRSFKTTGRCAMGDACQFAHAAEHLRRWGHCTPEARAVGPAGRDDFRLASQPPDALRAQSRRSATEGTASTSSAAGSGIEEEDRAELIEFAAQAVHAWNASIVAGPPGLTTCALNDAGRYYADRTAVQDEGRFRDQPYDSVIQEKV
ncbi:unnamed protein product [Prorocentrum cordatum]|uniref:C3H1-type domain-containing protein n=1 Tax=Prorocentrum cordatum TaxID=2364126 RepID=A0ABN9UPV0_9DINO|nr:unnamed protein product [Polarella glacialis]